MVPGPAECTAQGVLGRPLQEGTKLHRVAKAHHHAQDQLGQPDLGEPANPWKEIVIVGLEAFVEAMKQGGRIPPDLPGRFKGHAYLLYAHAERPLVDDGVMLIGDSAGLAYTQSGEGIRPAVESALLAAEVIRSAGDYSASSLQAYGEAIARRFGNRAGESEPGWQLPGWVRSGLASALMRSHWFTRKVVTEKWFLHRDVPPLAQAV